MSDMFKWWETATFTYYRVPKILIADNKYKELSADAALLYGLLLDRICLSAKNKERFADKNGDLFVYFTLNDVQKSFNCGHDKATRLFNELEIFGLIARKRQGKGKPNRIYVLKFM